MRRWLWCLLLVGCEGKPLVVGDLVVEKAMTFASSPTDTWLATVQSPTVRSLDDLTTSADGTLSVSTVDVSSGTPVFGAPMVIDTKVSQFLTSSEDGTWFAYVANGIPKLWRAGHPVVALSSKPASNAELRGSFLYLTQGAAEGDASIVELDACTDSACTPIDLGSCVVSSISTDGTKATFRVTTDDGQDLYYFDGTSSTRVEQLPTAALPTGYPDGRHIDVSPDGTNLAYLVPGGGFEVHATADLSRVTWQALPTGNLVDGMVFDDASTLYLHVQASASTSAMMWVSTPTSSHAITPAQTFQIYRLSAGDPLLFVTTATATSTSYDISAYRPSQPQVSLIASNAATFPYLSHDRSTAMIFDGYDPIDYGDYTALRVLPVASFFDGSVATEGYVDDSNVGGANYVGNTNTTVFYRWDDDKIATFDGTKESIAVRAPTTHFHSASNHYLYIDVIADKHGLGTDAIDVRTLPL